MLLNDNVNQCFSDIFKPPPDYDQLPDKPFCPGILFDLSYAWVMFFRRLFIPAWIRGEGNASKCPTACNKCPKIKKGRKKKKCPIRR